MKSYLIFLVFSLLISSNLFAQREGKPIDYRFVDGEDNFVSFFLNNISLSSQVIENGIYGNSITRISLNPKGEINEITIINPIDSIVDNEILRVIDLSRKFWKKREKIKNKYY